jgi:hypothetical protein
MAVPGFTAGSSIYLSDGRYRTLGDFTLAVGPPLYAQTAYMYLDPLLFLGVNRMSLQTEGWDVQGCELVWHGSMTGGTRRECYTDSQWRSASPLSDCPGAEKNGALCYPFCNPGFHGAGPVCWQDCPDGYSDDGATCRLQGNIYAKPSYGRGVGSIPWPNCNSSQEYDAGLCYTKCNEGYHGVGPVCWGTCKPGYVDDGGTCRPNIFLKKSYGRGVGWPMSCPSNQEQIGALCYGDCPNGYVASGVRCDANMQTCVDVPVTTAPDYSKLATFCFASRKDSWAEPCKVVYAAADTEEHARQMLYCSCSNCVLERVDCSAIANPESVCH